MKTIKTFLLNSFILCGGVISPFSLSANIDYSQEPMIRGKFEPSWESLSQYEVPEWFKDAKFGIWAHWGPQCEPEAGDWYARFMYYPGGTFDYHVGKYGNPKDFGFKDVINEWKADKWDPDALVELYKKVGAQYFMALGNHHDNMDLWDSKYQPWNTVNMGPKRDVMQEWADACKKYSLPLGVSIHASHAWTWMEPSQDYDGKMTKEDGIGKWWEGYDPQDLYVQNHERSAGSSNSGTIHSQWEWGAGASIPSDEFMTNIYNRTLDVVNKYNPDLLYFDDSVLPFYPISDVGNYIAAHFYNKSLNDNDDLRAVIMAKKLEEEHKECILWDVERGAPDKIQEKYWQTCTCIGDWHYNQNVYNNNSYKSAKTVIHMLVDIISKNGNLLLSIPLKGNGSLDDKELKILNEIADWMTVNSESIYGTRPWVLFGEGPTADASNPINNQGFNEGTSHSNKDIRFVTKDGYIYATMLGNPSENSVFIKSLAASSGYVKGKVNSVEILGYGKTGSKNTHEGLSIDIPLSISNNIATVFKIEISDDLGYSDLQDLLRDVKILEQSLRKNSGTNTGQYHVSKVNELLNVIIKTESIKENDDIEIIKQAYYDLQSSIGDFYSNSLIEGGVIDKSGTWNVTANYLEESRNFSRKDVHNNSYPRFGIPEYWNVENYEIPQSNSDGTKQGIDKYPGYNTLMMGVWNDRGNSKSDLKNSIIYRIIRLPKGEYYFGSVFEAHYQLYNAYMFVADDIPSIENIMTETISHFSINEATNDGNLYGLKFTIEEEKDIYIGWCADMSQGSSTQEFRISEIALLKTISSDQDNNTGAIKLENDELEIGMSRFAELTDLTYLISSKNLQYIKGAKNGIIDLGYIDFGTEPINNMYVYTASSSSVSSNATYDVYLDDNNEIIASITPLKTYTALTFKKSEAEIPDLTGLNKVTIKYNDHASNLLSIGFVRKNLTNPIDNKEENRVKYHIHNRMLYISECENQSILIYNTYGQILENIFSNSDNYQISLPTPGVYLIKIGNERIKSISTF